MIRPLKKGMTNDSFYFGINGYGYVIRLNGAGTDQLIDRQCELDAYEAIRSLHISENVIAISAREGYKITSYIDHAHNCDAKNRREVPVY